MYNDAFQLPWKHCGYAINIFFFPSLLEVVCTCVYDREFQRIGDS